MFSWKDIGIPVISAILGSSLLGIFVTSYISLISKPNFQINVIVEPDIFIPGKSKTRMQIEIANTGGSTATNVTAFMFVPGMIVDYDSPFHDEPMSISKAILRSKDSIKPFSELRVNTSRLSPGSSEMISIFAPGAYRPAKVPTFYLAVSSDQASGKLLSVDQSFRDDSSVFFYLTKHRQEVFDVPIDQKILWISLALSLTCFAVSIGYRWKIFQNPRRRQQFLLSVLAATIIMVVCEALPISYFGAKIISTDLRLGIPLDATSTINGREVLYSEFLINLGLVAIIFVLVRTFAGYFVAKKIILIQEKSSKYKFKEKSGLKLFGWSILLIGLPLEFIILFLFDNTFIYFLNLFVITLIFDVTAMIIIVFIVGRRLTKQDLMAVNSTG